MKKIEHLGIAVKDIDKANKRFAKIFGKGFCKKVLCSLKREPYWCPVTPLRDSANINPYNKESHRGPQSNETVY